MPRRCSYLFAIVVVLFVRPSWAQVIVYVAADAPSGGDGTSWRSAFRYLRDGLQQQLVHGSTPVEVRVARGLYRPDQSDLGLATPGSKNSLFRLWSRVSVLGGFAGPGSADPDERDPSLHLTTLTGVLTTGVKCHQVIRAIGASQPILLDGVHVIDGHAASSSFFEGNYQDRGGGIFMRDLATITIRNCVFRQNKATNVGGAVWSQTTTVDFIDCIIDGNEVVSSGNAGGGLHIVFSSKATFLRCAIRNNKLKTGPNTGGGAMFIGGNPSTHGPVESTVIFDECEISHNSGGTGGAILNNGILTVRNTLFSGNVATIPAYSHSGYGGAIASLGQTQLENCTFVGNDAPLAGGALMVARNSGNTKLASVTSVSNCVLWGNASAAEVEASQVVQLAGTLTIQHSCVEGWSGALGGVANFGSDPLFADPIGDDGKPWSGDEELRLAAGSPCIDAGHNDLLGGSSLFDLAGAKRRVNDPCTLDCPLVAQCGVPPVVDVGAFEYQPACPHDLDCDGSIGSADLALLLEVWGGPGDGDIDGDGVIDGKDLSQLLGMWGACRSESS